MYIDHSDLKEYINKEIKIKLANKKVTRKYVFIVLEHDTHKIVDVFDSRRFTKNVISGKSAIVHGVYINKEEAEGKRRKIIGATLGYIAVLKLPLQGKSLL